MSRAPLTAGTLLAVAVGGAIGALVRWAVDLSWAQADGFPWTTLAVNVTGAFLLAALPALAVVRRHHLLPPFLGSGMLGGFTTLSLYADEGRGLLADGAPLLAGAYLLGTLGACLVAVQAGHLLSTAAAQQEFDDEEGNE